MGSEDNFSTKPAPSSIAAPSVVFSIAESDFQSDTASVRDNVFPDVPEYPENVMAELEQEGLVISSPPPQHFEYEGVEQVAPSYPQRKSYEQSPPAPRRSYDTYQEPPKHSGEQVRVQKSPLRGSVSPSRGLPDSWNGSLEARGDSWLMADSKPREEEGDEEEQEEEEEKVQDKMNPGDNTEYLEHERERTKLSSLKVRGLLALLFQIVFWTCLYFGLNFEKRAQ